MEHALSMPIERIAGWFLYSYKSGQQREASRYRIPAKQSTVTTRCVGSRTLGNILNWEDKSDYASSSSMHQSYLSIEPSWLTILVLANSRLDRDIDPLLRFHYALA